MRVLWKFPDTQAYINIEASFQTSYISLQLCTIISYEEVRAWFPAKEIQQLAWVNVSDRISTKLAILQVCIWLF